MSKKTLSLSTLNTSTNDPTQLWERDRDRDSWEGEILWRRAVEPQDKNSTHHLLSVNISLRKSRDKAIWMISRCSEGWSSRQRVTDILHKGRGTPGEEELRLVLSLRRNWRVVPESSRVYPQSWLETSENRSDRTCFFLSFLGTIYISYSCLVWVEWQQLVLHSNLDCIDL